MQQAQFLRQCNIGLDAWQEIRRHGGHVDSASRNTSCQIVDDLLCNADRHILLRLRRRGTDVRRADEIIQRQQWMVRSDRLLLEDIERGTGDLAVFQGLIQVLLADNPASGAIDDSYTVLHRRNGGRVDHVLRLARQRSMHRDDIGPPE